MRVNAMKAKLIKLLPAPPPEVHLRLSGERKSGLDLSTSCGSCSLRAQHSISSPSAFSFGTVTSTRSAKFLHAPDRILNDEKNV